jgi:hypothetical protein
MNVSSQSGLFIFNLPVDFVSPAAEADYMKILRKNRIPAENVVSYLNSAIKEIAFPGLSFDLPTQNHKYGKEISWKSSKNVYDTFTKELDITFKSVNSHLNYFIMLDMCVNHYLDVQRTYDSPLFIRILDKHKDALFEIRFRSVNLKGMAENRLNYSDLAVEEKTFTLTFAYNYMDIENLLTSKDIISDGPNIL